MIYVPVILRPHINVEYPINNKLIFEEWFYGQDIPKTEREYLPIFWTSFYVNNGYGQNKGALQALQVFLDDLPTDKKYYTICQYDDAILNNVKHLDLFVFNMSEAYDYPLPLLCQPHPYQFDNERNIFASFVGSHTHPIREKIFSISGSESYISDTPHSIQSYCEVLSKSLFSLCPRGYGKNSFRLQESLQYGAIPVYISDSFVFGHNLDFNDFGVVVKEEDAGKVIDILKSIPTIEIIKKQHKLKSIYNNYFTYEANFNLIIKHLETEHSKRKD